MLWSLVFFLFSIAILTIVYYVCYFALAIAFRVNNRHYLLGVGKGFFEFRIKDVLFTVGIFIPVFGLARVYQVEGRTRRRPDYPWQFFDRPLWIRFIVTFGGVISLFFFALIILVCIRFFVSEQFISRDEINKNGTSPSALAEQYGFQRGDKVMTVNGRDFESYDELLNPDIYAKAGNTFKIIRRGEEKIIEVPEGNHSDLVEPPFLDLIVPVEIDSVFAGSSAEESRLQKGDRIVSVNGVEVDKANDMQQEFGKDVDRIVDLQIQRISESDTVMITLEAQLDEQYKLGIFTRERINYTTKANSFFEAVRKGIKATLQLASAQVKAWFGLTVPEKKRGGPVSISSVLYNGPNWEIFWYVAANWAVMFGTWNFCPFPRSAFWETIPLAYEGVTRKRFAYSVFAHSRALAWAIFWGLILFTLVMDIRKLF